MKLVIHEVGDYRPAGYSLQEYTKTPTQTQNIDLDNLICFLFAMTVTSFINVGRACDPADTVTLQWAFICLAQKFTKLPGKFKCNCIPVGGREQIRVWGCFQAACPK
jgi:hypothetical protein